MAVGFRRACGEDNLATGNLPASFAWLTAALSVPNTPAPPPDGGDGCTPGYWKQTHHLDAWTTYSPDQDSETVFGVDAAFGPLSLLEALKVGGGQDKALTRHSVAALLNAASPNVSYALSEADIITLVQNAYATGDFNGAKAILEAENELGCPLN